MGTRVDPVAECSLCMGQPSGRGTGRAVSQGLCLPHEPGALRPRAARAVSSLRAALPRWPRPWANSQGSGDSPLAWPWAPLLTTRASMEQVPLPQGARHILRPAGSPKVKRRHGSP